MLHNLYPTSRARYLNSTKPVRVAAKETTGGYNIQTMSYIFSVHSTKGTQARLELTILLATNFARQIFFRKRVP